MLTDDELPALARALDIPGFVDIHTHFMPDGVLRKVWAYFDAAGTGHRWPIQYRLSELDRLLTLEKLGVVRFTALNYAHRPGMAAWLNDWNVGFARMHPQCAQSATFYPDDDAASYVAQALEHGAEVFKVHLVVGNYDPWHVNLRDVWCQLEDAQVPVVIHAGAFPTATPWTGAGRLRLVLEAHPELCLVMAHLGGRDYIPLWELGIRYPNVHWDTTMAFTDLFQRDTTVPPEIVAAIGRHPDRVVLGTDFPNMPHRYAHQIEVLQRLGFGDGWMRQVCFENGARLLNYDAGEP